MCARCDERHSDALYACAVIPPSTLPSAPPPPTLHTGFATSDCTALGTPVTIVSSEDGLCQLSPSTPGFDNVFAGYRATCDADGRGGSLEYCATSACDTGCTSRRFDQFTCMPNDPAFGSSSL